MENYFDLKTKELSVTITKLAESDKNLFMMTKELTMIKAKLAGSNKNHEDTKDNHA